MTTIRFESANQNEIEKKPRVWFTCHPADFDKYFSKICKDIFMTHDCTIYYTEDMNAIIAEDEKEVNLGRCNLFVVPVTSELLTTPNRAMDQDIPYAFRQQIPVLPFMMEQDLDALYAKPDKFGELQYLNPLSKDITEVPYADKLKNYLESVLVSNAMAKRIRAAFDAYVFLSYRKKDRKFANELMHLIHSNPECRDIAIWFDEFLTPGESFKANIEKLLNDCRLFTLLVTPQLLEEGNYVLSTELPMARQKKAEKGTDILAVEMEKTDPEALRKIEIEEYIHQEDTEFRARLLDAITKIATTENDTPEHNFLIGLAYLDGIDVEVNRTRGVELITSAAEDGLFEAMQKLYGIYRYGEGVPIDYEAALEWAKRIQDVCIECFGEEHLETVKAMEDVALCQYYLYQKRDAADLREKAWRMRCKLQGKAHPDTIEALLRAAQAYEDINWTAYALERYKAAYVLRCKTLGEDHEKVVTILPKMAGLYKAMSDEAKATELYEKAYASYCKTFGQEHQQTWWLQSDLVIFYSETGNGEKAKALILQTYERLCRSGEDPMKAAKTLVVQTALYSGKGDNKVPLELYQKAYAVQRELGGEDHPDTRESRKLIINQYLYMGDYRSAIAMAEQEYDRCCGMYGTDHPDTLEALYLVIYTYNWEWNEAKTLELWQKVYERQCRVLGPEHPDTVIALRNVANATTDNQQSLALWQKIYALDCKVLGESHEDTQRVLFSMASVYENMGDYGTALTLCEKLCTLWQIEEDRPKYYVPGSEYAAAEVESLERQMIRQMRARLREKLQ